MAKRRRTIETKTEPPNIVALPLLILIVFAFLAWLLYFSGLISPGATDPAQIDPRIVPADAPK